MKKRLGVLLLFDFLRVLFLGLLILGLEVLGAQLLADRGLPALLGST